MTQVSLSWLDLKPNQDQSGNQEELDAYIQRIRKVFKEFNHIQNDIFEQWIWAHHNNSETLRNYGWLNYENFEFVLCNWTNDEISNVNIIDEYSEYVKGRASFSAIRQFCCNKTDLNYWKNNGTWRTPPIILDVYSIEEEFPRWSEIKYPYQLIEGHSRLGYLKSMINMTKQGKAQVANTHSVYIMKSQAK
ncbi:hypothetical protein [Fulvivirga sediminis]|uniref:Uncharacterized protein n=1 Tax=Fulvivirga sediminis TaxID=2803949 RepID=A0A937F4V7_9BACT|nr:hypothetical protein [Fulvivirga sediminis]MBL3654734.1 hypothetical protein [Fulvivirga sediminis]